MGTELTTQQSTALSVTDAKTLAETIALADHGKNAHEKKVGTDMLKIVMGADMGIGPGAALRGINIVHGKPELAGALWAALIGASPCHKYRVLEKTNDVCRVAFSTREMIPQVGGGHLPGPWEELGVETFTMKMAETAGLLTNATYKKYPAQMLLWRALANGARTYTPEVTMGAAYAEGELSEGLENGIELPSEPVNVTPHKSDMDLLMDKLAICSGILQGPENTDAQKAEKRRAHKDLIGIQADQLEAPDSARLSPKRMARLEELIDIQVPA